MAQILPIELGLVLLLPAVSSAMDTISEPREVIVQTEAISQAEPDGDDGGQAGYFTRYLFGHAQAALKNERYAQAATFVERALERDPQNREMLLFAAKVAEKRGNWSEAESRFSQLLAVTPNDGQALAGRGLAKWRQGNGQAAEDLSQALAGGLSDGQLREAAESALANIKAGLPAPSPSVESDSASFTAEDLAEDWALVGPMGERGDWAWLDRFFTRLLHHSPDAGSYAYVSRGFARMAQGRHDDAEQDFITALNRTDLTPQTRSAAREGLEQIEAGRRQTEADLQAAAEWEETRSKAAELVEAGRRQTEADPQAAAEWEETRSKAAELEADRDWAGLDAYFTGLLGTKPHMKQYAFSSRGFARMAAGRLDEAAADFQAALPLTLDPQVEADLKSGLAEIGRIQAEAARRQAETKVTATVGSAWENVESGPNVWADFHVMEEHLLAGRFEALPPYVDRLRSLKLRGEERGRLAYFQGEILWAGKQYDQAHKHYLEAVALVFEQYCRSNILWRLAEYSRLQGDRSQAIEYAEQSAAVLPEAYWRLNAVGDFMIGYGRDKAAVDYFQRSLSLHKPGRNEVGTYLNLFNAYNRLGDSEAGLGSLRRYIDRATAVYAELDDLERTEVEGLFDARRTHSYINRTWGLDSYIFGADYQNGDHSAQMVNELYGTVRRAGMIFQPYVQLNGSLSSRFSGTYYAPWLGNYQPWIAKSNLRESLYGIIGLRVHPFPQLAHSLTFGLEQTVKIGTLAENDTWLRANHFWETGLDLEPYVSNWPSAIVLNQATYSTRNNDLTAFGEVRGGRSLRLDALDDRLVITPHISMVWRYGGRDIDKGQRWGLEAGPGLSLRKWYREDKYNAPQSSADVTVQYRWGLSHDQQNVLSVTLSHSF